MTTQQKVVAVTGSSGHIGAKLLEHLEEMPGLGKLVAFDTRPLRAPVHNIAAFRRDVAEPIHEELAQHGVTTLVHLAFAWRSGLKRREAAANSERNLAALERVIESCIQAGVGHLVYVSSHSVYGARPDNPVPLNEDCPLRPSSGFPYAQDNYRAERLLSEKAEENPDFKVAIFRSCPVLGPMTGTGLMREFFFPGWVGLSDYNPPLQFVDDDDLARLMCLAIGQEVEGTYNVAGDGVAFLRELAPTLVSGRVQLPAALVYPLKRLTGGTSVAYSHFLDRWPIIMSTAKLRRTTGFRFRHTATEAVASFGAYNAEAQERMPKLAEVRWPASGA